MGRPFGRVISNPAVVVGLSLEMRETRGLFPPLHRDLIMNWRGLVVLASEGGRVMMWLLRRVKDSRAERVGTSVVLRF